ncbi:MAG: cell division protein FtsZ [Bacteroidetes bacterium]|nr:cell division protein FtsZ [Bacteroidota bacterium]
MFSFEMPRKDNASIIKVIGVGGGGSNAVNHMFRQGITGVDFMVCNTDHQALNTSPVPIKIPLGQNLTEGRGAGSIPEIGRKAAIESIDDIRQHLSDNTKMVFITAGLGGGTGTGAAPVIAKLAKEMGILTVGIVTIPFQFEGKKRGMHATSGLEEIRNSVDTLLIISNDRLREIYGNLSLTNAFGKADDILTTAAKGIAEIITVPGYINVDFEDVKTVMTNGGAAIMGAAITEGENRAALAAEQVLNSPLLDDSDIHGAKHILLYISYGENELTMDEVTEINEYVQEKAGMNANMIWGTGQDQTLGQSIRVTLIATGFNKSDSSSVSETLNVELDTNFEPSKPQNEFELERLESLEAIPEAQSSLANEPSTITVDLLGDESPRELNTSEYTLYQKEDALEKPLAPISRAESPTPNSITGMGQRREMLENITAKLQNPARIAELEQSPAYMRKKVELELTPTMDDRVASKSTLSMDGGEIRLRDNNSFLHDSVD